MSPEVPMIARLPRTLAAKDEQITALQEDVDQLERIVVHCGGVANGYAMFSLSEPDQLRLDLIMRRASERQATEMAEIRARRYDLEHPDAVGTVTHPNGFRDALGIEAES